MAVGEQLEPLDRFAPTIGAGALHRHKTGNWPPVLGDREALAPSNSFEQRGEVSLSLVGTNFLGHCILRLV
jgi:hypothetical protein